MILTDLSNTIKNLWEKISFHKHFKAQVANDKYLLINDLDPSLSNRLAVLLLLRILS